MKRALLAILLVSLMVGPVGCKGLKGLFEPEPPPKQGHWCISIMPGDCS